MTETQIIELEQQATATIHDQVPMAELSQFCARALTAVSETLAAEGRSPSGPPFACYHGMPTDTVDVEAGFPVSEPIEPADAVLPGVLPGGRAVEAIHVGSYDGLSLTYGDMQQRMMQEGLQPSDVMWEYYLTDAGTEPDPAQWRTRVLWPVS